MNILLHEWLLIVLTTLSAWDVHTTTDARKRGYGKEATPWLRWLNAWQEDSVFWFLLVAKVTVVVALWATAAPSGFWWYVGLCVVYGYFVGVGNTKLWYQFHFQQKKR